VSDPDSSGLGRLADFRETHVLDDGTQVELRPVRPEDAGLLRRGFDELSPESRYRRFFGGVPRMSDAMVHYLTEVDGKDHVAIVAIVASPDLKTERGVAIARFVRLAEDPEAAEAAVTVADDMQRKGLGRLLLVTLAAAAQARGIHRFRADVLSSNEPMRHMLLEAKARVVSEEDGVVTVDVPLVGGDHGTGDTGLLRRLFRVAASQMAVLVRRLVPPE